MSKLAILRGPKAVTLKEDETIWPMYGKEDEKAVLRILHSGYDCYEEMKHLEQEFKKYMGCEYALSVNNGTAGLHSAFFAVGLGAGDEIIAPSLGYWANCVTALNVGAVPVFADIRLDTLNIDPDDIERRITKRTKAIIVLHIWGLPCDMDAIMRIARKHKLKVIEDACHAHGAAYHGQKLGTIGDVGVFSFQASKIMTAIEGGMLVTNSRECYEKALVLGHYGELKGTRYEKFNLTGFGYKYRIHPVAAALARVQLRKLDAINRERNGNIEYFCKGIAGLPGVRPHVTPKNSKRVYYGFRLQYIPEELAGLKSSAFIAAMLAEGVSCGTERYNPKHLEPIFAEDDIFARGHPWNLGERWKLPDCYGPGKLPNTEQYIDRILSLPAWQKASRKYLDQMITAFHKVIGNIDHVPREAAQVKTEKSGMKAKIR